MNIERQLEEMVWRKEIQELRELCKTNAQTVKPIAFYGSSSIRLWDSIKEDLSPLPVINLGFGGSSYFWCDHFFEDVFEFVRPSKVILYAGDNDLGTGVPEVDIINSVQKLMAKIVARYGDIPIAIISVKPSPDREHLKAQIKSLNNKLSDLVQERRKSSFIDIHSAMLHSNGKIRPELYIEDQLHINGQGYEIWKQVIRHHIIKRM